MRPTFHVLDDELITQIVDEARSLLTTLGVTIHNPDLLSVFSDHGAEVDRSSDHVRYTDELIDQALSTAPSSFKLYDVLGNQTHDFSGDNVHFVPGSAAINIHDNATGEIRRPTTADYVRYAKLMGSMDNIAAQSTAFIPADVADSIADSYRLFLSLLFCEKPVVTGAFSAGGFGLIRDLQIIVRGGAEALRDRPLAMLSACPTPPLKWTEAASQNLVDCAKASIPVEYISMPLSGFMAPVTLVGSLIQHTAETLSGVVISQISNPGTPVLYGGAPAIFDMRYETTPFGAVETMMTDCAYIEIGRFLELPTQTYTAMSDAKQLDAQAGLETAMGATLGALAGANNISGPGILDFINTQSLEKLVVDNEICGMTFRLLQGIKPREDFPSLPIFQEFLRDKHLIIADHTRKHLKDEIRFPGPVIDRANRARFADEGGKTLRQRASAEVERLIRDAEPSRLADGVKAQLVERMEGGAREAGMDALPSRAG
ncbi:MAG: trimethylamine methyltransferase family protein [Gemmatimonadetes bacterium]|nr:trimethylamine methyltransferase family protein [Gemmatimonadota bacterium]